MRTLVAGMITTYSLGAVAWDYGQYVLVLERLDFEVYYVEDTGGETYDPVKGEYKGEYDSDCSFGLCFLKDSLASLYPTPDPK